ncbi:hypothetical protein VTK73DRAFT_4136 [Phialemonium thermophilum]|uniref:Amidase domain-containing protein n=1 Tax=Phialemonium thermophilum TaxID=223376 RepID=A0ABR3WVC7_9PEZI
MESWETIAASCQQALLDKIPPRWKLATRPDASITDVTGIPRECGLLSAAQLGITEQTASALVARLQAGQITSAEVTEAFCARAAIAHQCVNCLTDFFYEEAMARAKELDEILRKTGRPVGPLHGIPVAIKDQLWMKGKPATFAAVAWHDKIADSDASIVEVLQRAGAVPFARTAMPQTGMMLQTVSNLWGRTLNPFHRGFSAGGSSGGDGALVAMRGSPFTPSTDIGGSIRAPATFNGLYAIRPTAERIPKTGLATAAPGQISIKVSCGPVCHSVADVKLVTKILLQHYDFIGFEPTCVPFPWREPAAPPPPKLCFAVMRSDGVVTPQPPVRRALDETIQRLEAAGHTVLDFEPPFDLWEMAQDEWRLYFQTGAKEVKALTASTGEPLSPNFVWYLKTFGIEELTVPELFKLNTKLALYRRQFAQAWSASRAQTGTGRPFDALLCPCAPSAGFPHEFPVWWGYYALWNLLDYPSTILPLRSFRVDPTRDRKDEGYTPRTDNPFDRMNWEIYDPELWKNQPVCVQIVKPPYQDEDLIAVTEVVDQICNGTGR